MRIIIFLSLSISLLVFQNCSDASFSDVSSSPSGKLGADELPPEPGPPIEDVAEEDRPEVHEYYRCYGDDDSESSDDGDSNENIKVWVCHNDHLICISENALDAHLLVHVDQHSDELVDGDNYGGCDDDEDSESSDDEGVEDVDLVD